MARMALVLLAVGGVSAALAGCDDKKRPAPVQGIEIIYTKPAAMTSSTAKPKDPPPKDQK